ncbi:hypothetical protein [Falsiroseomonas oryziterrae]|uniref:hypothetical protein n=1 Tax=Falsiroseomonas oryziterrae TaxID=2911368 RepID=UPI001F1E2CB3|nr:hypothetical protein [Roseomonas sp. NPKOSM-4]
MNGTRAGAPSAVETILLAGGAALVVAAYTMPAVVFRGRGDAVHDLSIVEKLPVMAAVAVIGLIAALATRFVGSLRKWAEHATVAAIILALLPAIWGFVNAIDVWSGIRATILQMAGTRTVKIDPGLAYAVLVAGVTSLGFSLRVRTQEAAEAEPEPEPELREQAA